MVEPERGAALQVGTGAEGTRAGAGDDHRAHGAVGVGTGQCRRECREHAGADGVAALLAVDGEPHHGPAHFLAQFLMMMKGRGFGHRRVLRYGVWSRAVA
ncbi:hypothetical protein D9M68_982740 [compost metagenome]